MPSLPRADKLLVNAVWALLIAGGLGMCFGVLPPPGKRAIIEYAALVLGLYATSQALGHHFSESDAKLTALQRATDAKVAEAEQAKAAASAQERKFALATKQLDEEREAARQAFRTAPSAPRYSWVY